MPEPEVGVQTLEQGTDPLHVETRSHYVQTRLSSLPSPQAVSGGKPIAEGASTVTHSPGPLILHRVIVDPSAESESCSSGGLTAILPLLKQCTRCGSQRVRLLLVERPPVPSQTTPQKSLSPASIGHTQAHHQHQHHHHYQQPHGEQHVSSSSSHRPQPTTLPRVSQTVRGSAKQEHPKAHHHHRHDERPRHQRPPASVRSLTQPITYDFSPFFLARRRR